MRALRKMPSGSLSASCACALRPAPSLAGIRCQQDKPLSDTSVHGGKYQFDETYNVVPSWAELVKPETDMLEGTLVLTPWRSLAAVSIVNEEISWERFVVRLVGGDGADTAAAVAVTVTPESGNLAPRGGANNVCDPSKPYQVCDPSKPYRV
jgi:hypothetical protein